jgi:predicted Rossmann fold nucleotide-binding protein DprA/Smf involved in DNA uptake
LKVTLEARTDIAPEDRDLIMQLSPLYLEQLQTAKLEGEQQKQQEIALKMLRENISIDIIERVTGISIEQLQSLRSQLETN